MNTKPGGSELSCLGAGNSYSYSYFCMIYVRTWQVIRIDRTMAIGKCFFSKEAELRTGRTGNERAVTVVEVGEEKIPIFDLNMIIFFL